MNVMADQNADYAPAKEGNVIVYFIAFTGGYDDPSFFATSDQNEAQRRYDQWNGEANRENGDRVDYLVWNGETLRHA